MSSDDEVLRFIAARFPTVWALELLLLLRRSGGTCTRSELIDRLRASDLVISSALAALEAVRLVSLDEDGAVYTPANDSVEAMIERAEILYRRRPNSVCRAIVAVRTSSARAFADAFKLRQDRDD